MGRTRINLNFQHKEMLRIEHNKLLAIIGNFETLTLNLVNYLID